MNMDKLAATLSILKDRLTADGDRDARQALEAAVAMASALQDEKIDTVDALHDLLYDYRAQAVQIREMHSRYEVAGRPIRKDGICLCPRCHRRVAPNHGFCHVCGKRLEGW